MITQVWQREMHICNAKKKILQRKVKNCIKTILYWLSTHFLLLSMSLHMSWICVCRVTKKGKCKVLALETGVSNDISYQSDIHALIYFCYKIKIISSQNSIMLILHVWHSCISLILNLSKQLLWVCNGTLLTFVSVLAQYPSELCPYRWLYV